ncbi:hypothetical protein L1049_015347 [Liquidambar formosana]|uniref:Legume lectin domain-containing protein n=1 Tax=Liquidambar formosana TaxID=63359 RepID=A0AAP0S437_LIQFO
MDSQQLCSLYLLFCCFFFCFSFANSTTFNFSSFSSSDEGNISRDGEATIITVFNHPSLRLTDTQVGGEVFNGTGRAYYYQPIQLWSPITNLTTDFTTSFDFTITFPLGWSNSSSAGGFAFFLASENSKPIPDNSSAGWLGLFNETNDGQSSNQMVAVEFDVYQDQWDSSDNHVGIDENSIVSKANLTWSNTMVSGDIYRARVSYNGTSKDLNVFLKDPQVPVDEGSLNLTHNVDLQKLLPERVIIGFSASTGRMVSANVIRSWNFTSTLDLIVPNKGGGDKMCIWVDEGTVLFYPRVMSYSYIAKDDHDVRMILVVTDDVVHGSRAARAMVIFRSDHIALVVLSMTR